MSDDQRNLSAPAITKPSWMRKLEYLAKSDGQWTQWMDRELFPWEAREVLKALEEKRV